MSLIDQVQGLEEKLILEKLYVALLLFYEWDDNDFISLEGKHQNPKSYLYGDIKSTSNGSWCLVIQDPAFKMIEMKIYLNIFPINNNLQTKSNGIIPNVLSKYPFSIQHLQRMIDLLNFRTKNSLIYQVLFLMRLWRY